MLLSVFGTESSRSHERGSSPFAINVSGLNKSKKDTAGKKTTHNSNHEFYIFPLKCYS